MAALAAQAAAVVAMPHLGFHGFEGLLMSIVVAQVPTVLPLRASVAWALVQLLPLGVAVWPFSTPRALLDIFGAYGTFSAFSLLVYRLFLQERSARRSAAEAHAELLATRGLLVEQVRHNERLALSRELHDSLGHHLTGLKIQLELAALRGPGEARAEVEKARAIAAAAMADLRQVVSGNRRLPFALGAALKALAAGISQPAVHVEGGELEVDDADAAHALFRVAQEGLTNSLKHAQARNVWVALRREGEALVLTVRDDGRGGNPRSAGNGLTGLRDRLAEQGGRLEVTSPAGRGFALEATLPPRGRAP